MLRKFVLVTVVVLLAAASTAVAQSHRERLRIVRDVQREVSSYAFYTVFDDISVEAGDGGVVTLTGNVTQPHKKEAIEERVASVVGVVEVHNRINVLPVSSFDDELRYRIARAIYGNSAFWHYATRPDPPIHIIVDHGHVTLTGVVDSDVDRELARSLAWQFGAFSVNNALKTNAEVRAELERI